MDTVPHEQFISDQFSVAYDISTKHLSNCTDWLVKRTQHLLLRYTHTCNSTLPLCLPCCNQLIIVQNTAVYYCSSHGVITSSHLRALTIKTMINNEHYNSSTSTNSTSLNTATRSRQAATAFVKPVVGVLRSKKYGDVVSEELLSIMTAAKQATRASSDHSSSNSTRSNSDTPLTNAAMPEMTATA
jgi:hypothetical protein